MATGSFDCWIFKTLDTSGDGTLGEDDFDHSSAAVKKTLGDVWKLLVEQFDSNHDGVIESHEFLGHFIMYGLSHATGNPGEPQWNETFLHNFRSRVTEIETLVKSAR